MILRTIIFFLLLYLLIKVLSRFFLPSSDRNRSGGFFYTNRSNPGSGQRQNRNRNRNSGRGNVKQRLDQIEEAEYEEITDEEAEGEKSSKKTD